MENLSKLFQKQKQTKKKHLKRLSFITQLRIEFLLPFTSCRKVLGKMPEFRFIFESFAQKSIWYFDVTWLISQQLSRRDFKPVAFLVLVQSRESLDLRFKCFHWKFICMNANIRISRFEISRYFVKSDFILTMGSSDGEGLSQLYLELVDDY